MKTPFNVALFGLLVCLVMTSTASRAENLPETVKRLNNELEAIKARLATSPSREGRQALSDFRIEFETFKKQAAASKGQDKSDAVLSLHQELDQLARQVATFPSIDSLKDIKAMRKDIEALKRKSKVSKTPDIAAIIQKLKIDVKELENQLANLQKTRTGVSTGAFERTLTDLKRKVDALATFEDFQVGVGHARFFGSTGTPAVYLGDTKDNGGSLRLFDRMGHEVFYAEDHQKGGGAVFLNDQGKTIVYIGAGRESGAGFARFRNSRGKSVAYIGTADDGNGLLKIDGQQVRDYAEVFDLATRVGVRPGTVMSVVDSGEGIQPSMVPFDPKVVGVVSGAGPYQPAMLIGTRADGSSDFPIAVNGQVYVRVCGEGGEIRAGDLLVSSSRPGVRCAPVTQLRPLDE